MGTGRKRRENKKTQNMVSISWYLSEKVRVEMSKTQHFEIFEKVIFPKLAAKNIYIYVYIRTWAQGGSEERTKTIRGRWNPSRQGTLPVEVPPLEWPPTYMIGPRWKRRPFVDEGIPPDRVPFRSRFHRWNGFRHDRATMETKIIRGRWNPPPDMAPEAACLPCPAVPPAPNRQPQPCNMFHVFGLRAGARVLTTSCKCTQCVDGTGRKRRENKKTHKTWFPLVGTCQKTCGSKCQKHNTLKNLKK